MNLEWSTDETGCIFNPITDGGRRVFKTQIALKNISEPLGAQIEFIYFLTFPKFV
jgi:hypothetical protein